MNIREALLEDTTQNKTKALAVAEYAAGSAKRFKELMQCFLSNDYRLAQRAAWSVSWAARKQPAMVVPHIPTLVAQLLRSDVHPAVIRNSIRVLQDMEIPEPCHGELLHACFTLIENPSTAVAIKAFSLTMLSHLAAQYPEIKPELKLIIEDRWEHETAAFRSRAKKILKRL